MHEQMNILIVEDETAAAANLQSMLSAVLPAAHIAAVIDTVTDSIDFLRTQPSPDLIFMDIHLADGDSFRIFDMVQVTAPIIFTTAYDNYALQAFKVNSIDYLLKPLSDEALRRAVDKWLRLTRTDRTEYAERVKQLVAEHNTCRETYLVQVRDKIIPLQMADVAFFYTADERITAYTFDGHQYPVESTLERLQAELPQQSFFRANRQFIIARRAVRDITVWFGSRLKLNLTLETPENIVISKLRVPVFKSWIVDSPSV